MTLNGVMTRTTRAMTMRPRPPPQAGSASVPAGFQGQSASQGVSGWSAAHSLPRSSRRRRPSPVHTRPTRTRMTVRIGPGAITRVTGGISLPTNAANTKARPRPVANMAPAANKTPPRSIVHPGPRGRPRALRPSSRLSTASTPSTGSAVLPTGFRTPADGAVRHPRFPAQGDGDGTEGLAGVAELPGEGQAASAEAPRHPGLVEDAAIDREGAHVPLRGHVEAAVGVEGNRAGNVTVGTADMGMRAVGAHEQARLLPAPRPHGDGARLEARGPTRGDQGQGGHEQPSRAHGEMLPR